jgi:hypothetical protein
MAEHFDPTTLGILRDALEVTIHTNTGPRRGTVIWAVVVGDEVFVRSVRGPGAKWYTAVLADRRGSLALDDKRWEVDVTPVADPDVIDQVSQAYLTKYATSPYAQPMVRSEILSTTLRLNPR